MQLLLLDTLNDIRILPNEIRKIKLVLLYVEEAKVEAPKTDDREKGKAVHSQLGKNISFILYLCLC